MSEYWGRLQACSSIMEKNKTSCCEPGGCCNRLYWCLVYCWRCCRPRFDDLVELLMKATMKSDEQLLEYFLVRTMMEEEQSKGRIRKREVLNALGKNGMGALHYCARNDSLTMLLRLMNTDGIDLNIPDGTGFTPLHITCKLGHAACTHMLCNFGADVNVVDRKKNTPLILAASAGFRECCKALINHGAKQNVRNILGLTALMAAIIHQQASTALLLIKLGADLTVADAHGNTALNYAAEANMIDVARFLLENGASIRSYNKFNETPLLEAKRQQNEEMAMMLKAADDRQQIKLKAARDIHVLSPADIETKSSLR